MLSRLWTNLIILACAATLAGVLFFFVREYVLARARHQAILELEEIAEQEGPCAGLEQAREIERPMELDLERSLEARRSVFAARIVDPSDRQAQAALLGADADGLVDRTLCEQMKLVLELGEPHPVLELLRYTREGGDPCQDPHGLGQALGSLTSHRSEMLHALMEQVSRLHCIPPWLSTRVAGWALDEVWDEPAALDDVDFMRVAKFLETWSPVKAAQFSCLLETDGRVSRLAGVLGCTPYHKRHVLPRYRTVSAIELPARTTSTEATPDPTVAHPSPATVPAGSEVLLLSQEGERCQVRPAAQPPRAVMVPCSGLSFLSDVHVAILVESVEFGLVRASLVAGVVTYDGGTNQLGATVTEPDLKSWYGYDRHGEPLGMTHTVRLKDLGAKYGADVPDHPLRTFCRQSGARYCYDVDWAQVVGVLKGDPVVFLSRPMPVFLKARELGSDEELALFAEAFGRPPADEAVQRTYTLGPGADLVVEVRLGGVDLSWRLGPTQPWHQQSFGVGEGGSAPPTARLLAAMDLEKDGRPELLVQRIERVQADGGLKDRIDEVHMYGLDSGGTELTLLNRLTVHEY